MVESKTQREQREQREQRLDKWQKNYAASQNAALKEGASYGAKSGTIAGLPTTIRCTAIGYAVGIERENSIKEFLHLSEDFFSRHAANV